MSIRVALLGYGYVGRTFHAPLIRAVDGLALVAVGSRDATKVHSDLPGVHVGDYLEVLARPDVDLVVVATPNDSHHELAAAALAAGKHVVVDKPFTVTLVDARDLCARARASGRLLSVFHNLRWNADFLTVRALLEARALGDVVHYEAHFDRYRPEVPHRWRDLPGAGTGIWFDLGPHLLDQALQLFGAPLAVNADLAVQRTGGSAVDYFHVVLRYPRLRVVLHGSNLVAGDLPRFVVHGTEGSFVKHGQDTQEPALKRREPPGGPRWGHDPRDGVLYRRDGSEIAAEPVATLPGDWRRYYSELRDAIEGLAPNPVPPEEAVTVMALLEAGVQSAQERREIAFEYTRP